MNRRDNPENDHINSEWGASDFVHPETTSISSEDVDQGSDEALKEADRLKDLSKELRKDIKDNYKSYKKELKDSDDPLAEEKIAVAKEQSDELRDKIKSGIDHQRNELRGYDPDEAITTAVYLQDPMYGGAFFPDPTFGGVYPQDIAVQQAILQKEENQKEGKDQTEE